LCREWLGPAGYRGSGGAASLERGTTFAEPWQSRAFGVAVALFEDGVFTWPDFQAALVARIDAWEADPVHCDWSYYQHWLGALEDVVAGEVVQADEVTARAQELAVRPAGHDHRHDADHGHGHGHVIRGHEV
jgi:nitrile hydratase accessory protein